MPLDAIRFARVIVTSSLVIYYERELLTQGRPWIFDPADFTWTWSLLKNVVKKEQPSAADSERPQRSAGRPRPHRPGRGVTYRHGKLKRYSPEHHRVRIADPSGGPCRCSRSGSGSVRSWRRTRSRSMTPTFTSATSTAYAARADWCDRGQWGEHGSLNGRNVKASPPCTRKSKDHSRGNT
jgi:hypothetical protein